MKNIYLDKIVFLLKKIFLFFKNIYNQGNIMITSIIEFENFSIKNGEPNTAETISRPINVLKSEVNELNEKIINLYESPDFTGIPTVPTAIVGNNTSQIASTAFVQNSISISGGGDMMKSIYDASNTGTVDVAKSIVNWPVSVSMTEVGYLDGVTSNIQSQLTSSIKFVYNIEELVAIHPSITDRILVGGYYVTGDQGGGEFFWDENSTATEDFGIVFKSNYTSTGRWIRNIQGLISIKHFGAKGDDISNDTSFIQNALNYGSSIYFPEGNYIINSLLEIKKPGTVLIGAGRNLTIIKQVTNTVGILTDKNLEGCRFEKMTLEYPSPAFAGIGLSFSGHFSNADDFRINNAYIGISASGNAVDYSNGASFNDFYVYNPVSIGLDLTYSYNANITNFYITAEDLDNFGKSGMINLNHGQGHNFKIGEIWQGVWAHKINDVQFCKIDSVYFDSTAFGSTITNSVSVMSVNTWYSAGRYSTGHPGLTIGAAGGADTSHGLTFTASQFTNSGASGCFLYNGPKEVSFINCHFGGNSYTTGSNVKSGLEIASNTSNFSIIGCVSSNTVGSVGNNQKYGIEIGSGCTQFTIISNNLTNNLSGSILDNSSNSTEKYISKNIGCVTSSSGTATITSGTSSITVSHNLYFTPSVNDFNVAFTSNPASSGISNIWVSSVTASTVTFSSNTNASNNLTFSWRAAIKGA